MAIPTEFEIKLKLPSAKPIRLAQMPGFRQTKRTPRNEKLVSVYFDTDRLKLAKRGLTLRVRRVGRKHVQTIKSSDGGPFERGEWETPVADDHPDLKAARGTPLNPLLDKKTKQQLHPVFETRVRRRTYLLKTKTSEVALAIDRGEIDTGRSSVPLHEIELELKHGDKADLFELAQTLARTTSAELAVKSKSERGYELVEGVVDAVARGDNPVIATDASAASAFRAIAATCLKQVIANKAAVLAENPDGVHQMRIGLRRLRAALSLFSEILPAHSTAKIKAELRWLTDELGPAREFEVLLVRVVAPLEQRSTEIAGIRSLSRDLQEERRLALQRATAAVSSTRFRDLALDVACWIEVRAWQDIQDDPLLRERSVAPVETIARAQLDRRWRKIRKRGRSLATLDPDRRHKLRIQAKKLRYAAEFFETIFASKTADKRRKAFMKSLRDLQQCLGELNDIAVHENLSTAVAEASAARSKQPPSRAFAAGLVVGHEEARLQSVMNDAVRAYDCFREAKPYWQ
jgi:triphosphatase